MVTNREYTLEDKMITLIANDYRYLQVLSRFGIPLGFSDKTIEEVCKNENVDGDTFISIVNFLNTGKIPDISKLSLIALLQYLQQSHIYFLDFCLPGIRRKLLDGINLKDSDVSFLIIKLFDEYVDGIRQHMHEEEKHLFQHVKNIADKGNSHIKTESAFPVYSQHHEEVGSKLRELKNIIIKYCPTDASANLLNDAMFDLYRCEEELGSHCKIEDLLLLPAIQSKKNSHL